MTRLRTPPRANLSIVLGGLVAGVAGLGIVRWLLDRPRRRPTADELMAMDGPAFEKFIGSTGLRSATDLGVTVGATD